MKTIQAYRNGPSGQVDFPAYVMRVPHIIGRAELIAVIAEQTANYGEPAPTSRKGVLMMMRQHLVSYGDMDHDIDDDGQHSHWNAAAALIDKLFPELKGEKPCDEL